MSPRTIHLNFFGNFFFQFASLGVFLPFFALFLQDKGFSGTQIATIVMSVPLVQLFANPFYGYVADTLLPRRTIYRVALCTVLLLCSGFYVLESFWGFFFFIAIYGFFRMPNISILNAGLFEHLETTRGNYARIRIGGSLGFILFALIAGNWIELHGIARMIDVLIAAVIGHVLIGWYAPVNGSKIKLAPAPKAWRVFVQSRVWLFFLAGVFFSRMAEACYNVFFSVHMRALSFTSTQIGQLWAVAVLSEMLVLWLSPYILRRWPLENVLVFTYVVSVFRWLLTAVAESPIAMVALQSLHGITFGLFYITAVDWAYRKSPAGLTTTGQGVTNAVMFGLAGVAGALTSGPVFDLGGGTLVFQFAALLGLLAVATGVMAARASACTDSANTAK